MYDLMTMLYKTYVLLNVGVVLCTCQALHKLRTEPKVYLVSIVFMGCTLNIFASVLCVYWQTMFTAFVKCMEDVVSDSYTCREAPGVGFLASMCLWCTHGGVHLYLIGALLDKAQTGVRAEWLSRRLFGANALYTASILIMQALLSYSVDTPNHIIWAHRYYAFTLCFVCALSEVECRRMLCVRRRHQS